MNMALEGKGRGGEGRKRKFVQILFFVSILRLLMGWRCLFFFFCVVCCSLFVAWCRRVFFLFFFFFFFLRIGEIILKNVWGLDIVGLLLCRRYISN